MAMDIQSLVPNDGANAANPAVQDSVGTSGPPSGDALHDVVLSALPGDNSVTDAGAESGKGVTTLPAPGSSSPMPVQFAQNNAAPPPVPNAAAVKTPINPQAPNGSTPTGEALFSSSADILQSVVQTKQAELNAEIDANKKNTTVIQAANAAQDETYATTLQAFHNLEKINSLPGGANGGIARLLGLFDSDYNVANQELSVKEAQVKSSQIADRAKGQIELNNALPALYGKQAEIYNVAFQGQKDLNALYVSQKGLEQKDVELRISRAHLMIDMSQEQRAQLTQSIDQMPRAVQQANYDLALKGKGPFAGKAGLLELAMTREDAATVALHQANTAAQSGDLKAGQEAMQTFANNLPVSVLGPLTQDALSKGALTVDVGPPDHIIHLPLPMAQQALVHNQQLETAANATAAGQIADRQNLGDRLTATINAGQALASVDSHAGTIAQVVSQTSKSVNVKDPYQINRFSAIIDENQKRLQVIADKAAKQFPTKEAQAAVSNFASTGSFDVQGGQAVVTDMIGNAGTSRTAMFGSAFNYLNTSFANQIKQDALIGGGLPSLNTGNPNTDALAMIAQASAGKNKDSLLTMKQKLIADPKTQGELSRRIAGTVRPQIAAQVLNSLESDKKAPAFWTQLAHDPSAITGANGGFDLGKLAVEMEKASAAEKYKVDYAAQFMARLRSYSTNADQVMASLPGYTLADRALTGAVYGGHAGQAIMSDFASTASVILNKTRAEMKKRIAADVSGATQAAAMGAIPTIQAQPGSAPPNATVANPALVPSATGIPGMTADQVRSLFGG